MEDQLLNQYEADNDSGSDTDSQPCFSDDEDIFRMHAAPPEVMPAAYRNPTLEIGQRAMREVMQMIRVEPLLPLDSFKKKEERLKRMATCLYKSLIRMSTRRCCGLRGNAH